MDTLSTETFTITLAIIGVVIMISALLSGLIERSGLPQVAVFLALGAALGPFGLRLLNISLDSAALRVVATLSLALVLFTDAVSLNIAEVRRRATLALRVLGPGTLLSAALIALAGWWLLDLPLAGAAILGAALASTDPVLLRGLLRRRDIPVGRAPRAAAGERPKRRRAVAGRARRDGVSQSRLRARTALAWRSLDSICSSSDRAREYSSGCLEWRLWT